MLKKSQAEKIAEVMHKKKYRAFIGKMHVAEVTGRDREKISDRDVEKVQIAFWKLILKNKSRPVIEMMYAEDWLRTYKKQREARRGDNTGG